MAPLLSAARANRLDSATMVPSRSLGDLINRFIVDLYVTGTVPDGPRVGDGASRHSFPHFGDIVKQ